MHDWCALLQNHIQAHPELEGQDALKFLHQHFMGPGHLIPDPAAALNRLEKEWAPLAPNEFISPYESIGNNLCRLNLTYCKALGLSTKILVSLFVETANQFSPNRPGLENALRQLREQPLVPLTSEAVDAYLEAGCPAVSHSARYRSAYSPAYRVIDQRFLRYLPLLADIDRALSAGESVRIALDGPCASGKSTLGRWLSDLYRCPLVHMDDFFLLPQIRTDARLMQPGGNVDYERFDREVLTPLVGGESVCYRPWVCSTGSFAAERTFLPGPVTVIEGSYSLRPDLRDRYTHRVWVEADWPARRARILERGGPDVLARYEQIWIPLENRYFDACQVKCCCDYLISGNE